MFEMIVGNDVSASLLAFALVLIPAVIIHEFGHYIAAKSVGITILEFGIGFPPRVARLFTWRGTEFTLNLIPLGGFVRPLGEDLIRPQGAEEMESDRQDALNHGNEKPLTVSEAPPLARIWFMSAGALANLVTAFILFVVIGMLGVPEVIGARANVTYVAPDSPLNVAGLQPGDAIESVGGTFFASADELLSAIATSPSDVEVLVRRGSEGEPVNLVIALPAVPGEPQIRNYVRVMNVVADSPASDAGIQAGDYIAIVNAEPVTSVDQLISLVDSYRGTDVTVTLLRGEAEVVTELTPRVDPPAGQGAMGIEIRAAAANPSLGVFYQEGSPQQELKVLSFADAVGYSAGRFQELFAMIVSLPAMFLDGTLTAAEARPVSVIGISQAGGFFLQESIRQRAPVLILDFIAVISIALGLTNLLPIPALDGGRILFVLVELVRGKPLPPEREGWVHLIGFALLLSITVLFMVNDFINPITELFP